MSSLKIRTIRRLFGVQQFHPKNESRLRQIYSSQRGLVRGTELFFFSVFYFITFIAVALVNKARQGLKFLFIDFIFFHILFISRERGREGEREGEKHQCVVASHIPPTGDLARNPGMRPDWESNQRPFGLQAGAQSTEPHQPGRPAFLCYEPSDLPLESDDSASTKLAVELSECPRFLIYR